MSAKRIGSKCSPEYKRLRGYIKEVADVSATYIDGFVADAIEKNEKTIQAITSDYRIFHWGEAKNCAKYFINQYKDKLDCNSVILRRLLKNFLMASANSDSIAGADEELVDRFLNEHFGVEEMYTSNERSASVQRYSNLPNSRGTGSIIRSDVLIDIDTGIKQGKIVFLEGFTGVGKSYIASYFAKDCFDNYSDTYRGIVWNEDKEGILSLNTIVSNILSVFQHDSIGSMTTAEKVSAALRHLNTIPSILVIDNFESIDAIEKDSIIEFLLEKLTTNTAVIITCKNKMDSYVKISQHRERFFEVRLDNLTYAQWLILSKELIASFPDIRDAVKCTTELIPFVYKLCQGNPYFMSHIIAATSAKIMSGTKFETIESEYTLNEIDKTSHDWLVRKSFAELSDNEKHILVALSLFAIPATLKEIEALSGVSGVDDEDNLIEGTDLSDGMQKCYQQFLVMQIRSPYETRYSLPPLLRAIIQGEMKQSRYMNYSEIINNWISYFVDFSREIGFCFDDFSRLEKLDSDSSAKQAENIKLVLGFCYRTKRWKEYYEISENTKYYFYTRGVSGISTNSVHYKRAHAAKMLNDKAGEFNSLLYHCNVSCKAKEWDGIDECFNRINALRDSGVEMNQIDLMKLTYIIALYSSAKGEYSKANQSFSDYEKSVEDLLYKTDKSTERKQLEHDYIASLRWHSDCLYHLALCDSDNKENFANQAISLLDKAMELAIPINFQRAVVHSLLTKTSISLEVMNDYEQACEIFDSIEPYITVVNNDVAYNTKYIELETKLKESSYDKFDYK